MSTAATYMDRVTRSQRVEEALDGLKALGIWDVYGLGIGVVLMDLFFFFRFRENLKVSFLTWRFWE